jgi:uncharacterized membrane protein YfcA
MLGGLIGLGGAEFRLPMLIGMFGFPALEAVILNKATSLIVVTCGLVFRAEAVPFGAVGAVWPIILTLLAGSLLGAWMGADLATRLAAGFHRVIAVALVGIAVVLLIAHDPQGSGLSLDSAMRTALGVTAGFIIGVVASLLGVAGGELLIPTLVLLFGLDLKLAGSVSLVISLPTMLVGFARYSRDQAFAVLRANRTFMWAMALGSLVGVGVGGMLVRVVPASVLLPLLAAILLASAFKVWQHR